MNSASNLDKLHLVQGPSLRQRLKQRTVRAGRSTITSRLRRFREGLEHDMQPEPWTALQTSVVLILADVCNALELSNDERSVILGPEGEQALSQIIHAPVIPCSPGRSERQVKALAYVRRHGRIQLSLYRQLCPGLSDETLRLDLADLVVHGQLVKNSAKRWTYYTPGT